MNNSDVFNITGEFYNHTTTTGQDFKIIAIHPNRTVVLTADYDYQQNKKIQRSKLELSPKLWIAYNFNSRNKTVGDTESQIYSLELSYPRRNLSAEGWYSSASHSFDSNLELKWVKNKEDNYGETDDDESDEIDDTPKIMSVTLLWRNNTPNFEDETNHTVMVGLLHPSFEKNVTFKGSYAKSPIDFFKTAFEIEYTEDEMHLITFGCSAQDLTSIVGFKNYSLSGYAYHEASDLEFNAM